MGWQEDEASKRQIINKLKEENDKNEKVKSDLITQYVFDYWSKIVKANRNLPSEIRLIEHAKDGKTFMLITPSGAQYIEYIELSKWNRETMILIYTQLHGKFNISLNIDKNILTGTLLYQAGYDQKAIFKIDENDIDTILRSVCTEYNFVNGLKMISYENKDLSEFLHPIKYSKAKKMFLKI